MCTLLPSKSAPIQVKSYRTPATCEPFLCRFISCSSPDVTEQWPEILAAHLVQELRQDRRCMAQGLRRHARRGSDQNAEDLGPGFGGLEEPRIHFQWKAKRTSRLSVQYRQYRGLRFAGFQLCLSAVCKAGSACTSRNVGTRLPKISCPGTLW